MRKIHRIWYVICLVAGISLFITIYPFKSGVEGKTWFRCASKYDQALSKMWASGGALDDYYKVLKMEQKFLRTRQPTETEIISVLRSPNRRFQKVGLAAMFMKPIETDQLIDILFEFLQDQDPSFRGYARVSLFRFTQFPESRKDILGKQLLEIIKTREANELAIEEFLLLSRFPSKEAARFLTEQLMKEGEENYLYRNFAFNALKEMGNSYYDEAAEYVNKHGSAEIKKELLEREISWEKIKSPTGKE